jgi:antitoxin (DNA-binding transcriptional repressor) of toxin-antitoxin stability system
MKSLQVTEVGALADDVRNGEPVEIRDGDRVLAKVMPMKTNEEILAEMEKEGLVTIGKGKLPDWFLEKLPVDTGEGALDEFLADRRKNDW